MHHDPLSGGIYNLYQSNCHKKINKKDPFKKSAEKCEVEKVFNLYCIDKSENSLYDIYWIDWITVKLFLFLL